MSDSTDPAGAAALDEVYADRNRLVALAAVLAFESGYDVGFIDDPAKPEWPVVAVALPTGQCSWHVPRAIADWLGEMQHMTWDGHDNAEKAARIESFVMEWVPLLDLDEEEDD